MSNNVRNVKNAVLRQKFDASLPYLIRLAVAALTLSLVEIVSLFFLFKTTRIASSFNTREWPECQNDKQSQNKRHNLLRRIRILQLVMYTFILPAAQLCVSSALVAAETVLASNIRADPIIATYLDKVQREYPKLSTGIIENSLIGRLLLAGWSLGILVLHITVSVAGSLHARLNPTRFRLRDYIGGDSESTTSIPV